MRLTKIVLLPVLVAGAAAGCRQDPYRLRNFGDGAVVDGLGSEGRVDRAPSDFRAEAKPSERGQSWDACRSTIEVCNGVDDNCNGQIDEGFDKLGDPRFCESCKGCAWLTNDPKLNVALPGCVQGKCEIKSCTTGWQNSDGDLKNGCEYPCTPTGLEVCDGVDNDCNGKIDDGVTLSVKICKDQGPCGGTKAECKGEQGWICSYDVSRGVELQPCSLDLDCGQDSQGNPITKCDTANKVCPGIVINDEKVCDGQDGDCDGLADDPWANPGLPNTLGKECDLDNPPKLGACRNLGKYACDTTSKAVKCTLVKPGVAPSPETCNGIDDDCDGKVDNLDLTKNPAAESWVTVGTFQIFAYEASRPDATIGNSGLLSDGRACSVPGRLPWANITKEEALAACQRLGATLCTSAQWVQACKGQAGTLFPYGNVFDPQTCNGDGGSYDPTTDVVQPTEQPGGKCVSTWPSGVVYNLSGNLKEWTAVSFTGAKPTAYGIKGGAYDTPSIGTFGAGLSCDYDLAAPSTNLQLPTLGFRCCK